MSEVEQEEELLEPTEAPEESEETQEDETDQPRDEQGRFEEQPAEQPEEEPAAPTEEPEEEVYDPFSYRADGQSYSIEGSKVGSDGVFIPTDRVEDITRLLAEGRAHSGSFRQRMADSDAREQAANTRAEAADAAKNAIMDKIEELVSKDGALEDFILDQRTNWPVLKAEANAESLRVQGKADKERLEQFESEQKQAKQEPIMNGMLEDSILKFGQEANLPKERMAEIYQRFTNPVYRSIAFHPSLVDDPQAGITKGQMVIDYNAIRDEVNRFRGSVAAEPKREAKKPPPTISAKKTPAPAKVAAGDKRKFATTEELDDFIMAGGFDTED